MSDRAEGPGWWQASDGKWYPPELHPDARAGTPAGPSTAGPLPATRQVGRPRSAGVTILLSIVTLGIWTIVWSYGNGEELKAYKGTGPGGVVYALLTLFISPVTMFMMANEVETMYRNEHQEPPITTIWGLWFLLPLIGNIIWYVRIQDAINDFWVARGAAPATGP